MFARTSYKSRHRTRFARRVGAGATALAGLAVAAAPAGTFSFGLSTFSATEGGAAVVTLSRSGGASGEVAVTITVTGGTATAGTDFASRPYTITFPDGATAATLTIPFTDDTLVEGLETVTLALSTPTGGAVLGALTTATLSVNDNGTPAAGAGPVAAGRHRTFNGVTLALLSEVAPSNPLNLGVFVG
ncbi:hypothetical protein R5W23_001861 [Gemmata sp. JC673]|uniref:Calx-beta domain-containing protein n=1 Tax=Gemmata algarum TaxID=2975278 RepID=A0ABU5EZ99_9BACT|nr:Calx-beta domain-containing protein [Gemmata algarum]MDY3560616.1 hypothetical protein [Gemmata algarum]